MTTARQPTFFLPHGGGPCFFMDDPTGQWTRMEAFLHGLPERLPETPKAILMVSGHWETDGFTFIDSEKPELLFDYYNFPPHTYQLRYDAPGSPDLARRAAALLDEAGFKTSFEHQRGLDHGVFVPLKIAFPDADVPVVEMSLDRSLDPKLHLAAGRALAPLRDEGVLILGAGMTFHNMRGFGDPRFTQPSLAFDQWLTEAAEAEPDARGDRLAGWAEAPAGQIAHPREEHLIPLLVAAGASAGAGHRIYNDKVMEVAVSGFRFD